MIVKSSLTYCLGCIFCILIICQQNSYSQSDSIKQETSVHFKRYTEETLPEEWKAEIKATCFIETQCDSLYKLDNLSLMQSYVFSIDYEKYEQIQLANLIALEYLMDIPSNANAYLDSVMQYAETAGSAMDILSNAHLSLAFRDLLNNNEQVVKRVLDNSEKTYLENEKVKNVAEGIQILKFGFEDQLIRNRLAPFTNESSAYNKNSLPKSLDLNLDKKLRDSVFIFYQKIGKLYSQDEIGSVYMNQLVLFAHEPEMERRKFYQTLVETGVQKGIVYKGSLLNFILRTEMMASSKTPEMKQSFITNLHKREAELSKQYNLPNYHFSPF